MEYATKISSSKEIIHLLDLTQEQLNTPFMQSEIMSKIMCEVYNGWPEPTGIQRVKDVVHFLFNRIPQYAKIMNKSELDTLTLLAKSRNCNYINYFQNANIPDLSDVMVFKSLDEFKQRFPSGISVCPCCEGFSTDYEECNSGVKLKDYSKSKKNKADGGKVCDWKIYGLFGDLGKGIKILILDKIEDFPRPARIFKPIELFPDLPTQSTNKE